MAVRLQVLICTYGNRIGQLSAERLPRVEGVSYLVSWQNPDGLKVVVPARDDIEVKEFSDKGISRNRNHAFEAASAPYLLVSDDDLEYKATGLRTLIEIFETDTESDIFLTKAQTPGSRYYPDRSCLYPNETGRYSPISIEIALRRSVLDDPAIRFSELAGIGAPLLGCGEEELFLRRAKMRGLVCRFVPLTVVEHPGMTTSQHSAVSPGVIRAKGAVIRLVRGNITAISRYPFEAWRSPAPFFKALRYLWEGFFYSVRNKDQL